MIINAAILTDLNQPLRVEKIKSRPLKKGQILVQIYYSGACRSQLMEARGLRGFDKWLPHLLGHEGSGKVIDIGPGVTKFKEGDEVILSWIKSSGLEAEGAIYDSTMGKVNSGQVTTFSNYSVVSENRLIKKPINIDFDVSILMGCALPTGAGMVLNELDISHKSKVVVIGLGGIGLSALAMLLSLDVENIIAVDLSEEKLNLVRSWGVKNTINPLKTDVLNEVKDLFKNGADFCLESAGTIQTIELGFSLLDNKKGKLLFASHPPEGEKISLYPHELITGKKIEGSWGGAVNPDMDIPKFSELLLSADFPLKSLLSKPYTLNEINTVLEDIELGKVLRPLIKMEH